MAGQHSTDFKVFHKFFPELTPIQTETAMHYCYGREKEEVALIRRVSVLAVDKVLTACRRLLNVDSLGQLRTVVLLRINECIMKNVDLFPELTSTQRITALLYSFGRGREEVADIRHVSVPAVDKSLSMCRRLLNADSLGQLATVVLLRITIGILMDKPEI